VHQVRDDVSHDDAGRRRTERARGLHVVELAELQRLAARDPFVRLLGIECIGGGDGSAAVRLRVDPQHLNFNGGCRGATIFALVDTAFGLALNSHGRIASGIEAHISFHVGVREGDLLTARAVEIARGNKVATYRIDVSRDDATLVASFSGTVYVSARANEPDTAAQA